MSFHLGKPILVMMLIAAGSGLAILGQRGERRADLTVWVFHDSHAQAYRSIAPEFTRRTGLSVDVKLIASRALNVRLESIFMSGLADSTAPDLVEIEISDVGKYFRPPLREMGFVALDDLLKESGYDRRIVASRFAPWSKEGVIFGVPHDVHPVSIVFRDDLFREVGIDLGEAKTWGQFQERCLLFQERWRAKDAKKYSHRHAMELRENNPDQLLMMLLQRGINLIDDFGRVHVAEEKVVQTAAFYAQLVVGPRKIGAEGSTASGGWVQDFLEGNICALMTPDWRMAEYRQYVPSLAGKLRMMPLPVFDAGDAPTSTWGGTMMGIVKSSKRQKEAWELLQFLYFSREGIEARRRYTDIVPPVRAFWSDAVYQRPDSFFRDENGGPQKIGEMYVRLAERIPPRYVTPATTMAQTQLSVVMWRANRHLRQHGPDGLEDVCRHWLRAAAEDLKGRIKHGKFEQ
jgi:arabinosaccharide transport system substrate-binding protein